MSAPPGKENTAPGGTESGSFVEHAEIDTKAQPAQVAERALAIKSRLNERAGELVRQLYPEALEDGRALVLDSRTRVSISGLGSGRVTVAGQEHFGTLIELVASALGDDCEGALSWCEKWLGQDTNVVRPADHQPPASAPSEPISALAVVHPQRVPNGEEQSPKASRLPDIQRLLPQAPDAEKGVISSFLIAPKEIGNLCAERGIKPEHFHIPAHALIFNRMQILYNKGAPIDFITLTNLLRDEGLLDQCGGPAAVTELFTYLPTAANAGYYIEILIEKWALREQIRICTRGSARAYDQQDDPWGLIEETKTKTLLLADAVEVAQGVERGMVTRTFKELMLYDTDHDPNTIIGRRWLCRGGACLWIGQSGIGKSSLAMQVAVRFAVGLTCFGIAPKGPLRSVFIQAENDDGDLAEMAQGVMKDIAATVAVTPEMMALWNLNLVFVRDTVHTGDAFAGAVRRIIRRHTPDLLWMDPLLSFVGDDISKQAVASHFLRDCLNPILLETGVCLMVLHHTGKPSTDPKSKAHWKDADMAYASFGSSELVNWARAVNVLRPLRNGTYELHLTKRGKRAGATNLAGNFTDKIYLAHADHGIAWRQVEEPQDDEEEPTREGKKRGQDNGQFKTRVAEPLEKIAVMMRRAPDKVWSKAELVSAMQVELVENGKAIAQATAYRYYDRLLAAEGMVEILLGGSVRLIP